MAVNVAQPAAPLLARPTRDEVIERDSRSLAFDGVAAVTLFLIVVGAHLLHPLLLHESQFGRAWRNQTLQPVLALALMLVSVLLVRGSLREWANRRVDGQAGGRAVARPYEWVAAGVLLAYAGLVVLAVVLRMNLFGTLLRIDAPVFAERPNETWPLEQLGTLFALVTAFEFAALAAAVWLWKPWARLGLYADAVRRNAAPLLMAALVLVVWETLIAVFRVQEFLLPRPTVIGGALIETYPRLVSAGWNTFQNAFWGFAIGCGLGILTGVAAARFTAFSRALLPVAVAVNAIPIIALAPIFNNWFGALNAASKIAIVAVLAYFPTMISTVKGLTSADPLQLELMRSYAAGNWAIFSKLRAPTALPFVFSALKVATTLSMIGAIVSEYFGGSTAGLGYRIRDDAGLFKYPEAWAAIFVAALFGIGFYLVVTALERALMHWHVQFREGDGK